MKDFSDVLQAKRQVPVARVEQAVLRSTWQDIGLVIEASASSSFTTTNEESLAPDLSLREAHRVEAQRFLDRGIGTLRALLSKQGVKSAFDVVKCVENAGWPLVFAFVDDRLWQLLGEESLNKIMDSLLGRRAQQLPGIWVHQVENESRGWEPHVDVSGPPKPVTEGVDRITLWLPLTSASHDNGCIFAVPGSHRMDLMQRFDETETVSLNEVIRLFHKAEAMEANPGDALMWRFQTLHWGGPSLSTAKNVRTSLSIELGHSEVPAHGDAQPTWPLGAMPSFETRLFLIGRSLVMYGLAQDREPFASRFVDVGRALVEIFSR